MDTARVRGLSAKQRSEMWKRWRDGQTLSDIAQALSRSAGTIFTMLEPSGGIEPAQRRRNRSHLSHREREEISRQLCAGATDAAIAKQLRRPQSTISREIKRNGGRERYRAEQADARACKTARRPKQCKLAQNEELRLLVAEKLQLQWAPEQIAGWLRLTFPCDPSMHVSHETIYLSLFVQARGVLKRELMEHLRSNRKMRRARNASRSRRTGNLSMVSIRERPPDVADRAVPGHWEGDLLSSVGNSHIATLVERKSRFTMLVKVAGRDTESVVSALSSHIQKLPKELRATLTWDRGTEMADHKRLSIATDVKVYFCDPQNPWQRGTNENTNRLLRQYFPVSKSLRRVTQDQLDAVALRLNQRPRKTLGFLCPAEVFAEHALTG